MSEDQDPGGLLLLRLWLTSLQAKPRSERGEDGSLHDLRHQQGQDQHRRPGRHADRGPHRQRAVRGDWAQEVAVRRLERRRDHGQHHGADRGPGVSREAVGRRVLTPLITAVSTSQRH